MPDVFSQIKILTQDKGMELKEAIKEIETKLRSRLPEHIIILIKEEVENGIITR